MYTASGDVVELQCNGEPVHNVRRKEAGTKLSCLKTLRNNRSHHYFVNFLAPVKLEYDYSDEELIFLMVKCSSQ
ncbi:hypothetical protein OH492_25600 [Vibrio chagasii]|nr:hypothetical protein [Vibrio chagasii]